MVISTWLLGTYKHSKVVSRVVWSALEVELSSGCNNSKITDAAMNTAEIKSYSCSWYQRE